MTEAITTLPSANEILQRLAAVDDNPYTTKYLHPLIAVEGGKKLAGTGVVIMLVNKLHDLTGADCPQAVTQQVFQILPSYIDVLIDQQNVVDEAKRFLANNAGRAYMAMESCEEGTRIFTHAAPLGTVVAGKQLWSFDKFNDLVFGEV